MPQIQVFLADESKITFDLTEEKITVGRLADKTLQIDDGSVSSNHAEIVLEGGQYHLHDVGSTNGTFVNGEQVTDAILNAGDEIRFGHINAVYIAEEAAAVSQPRPESHAVIAEAAHASQRPADFKCTSPVTKVIGKKDPVATATLGLAIFAAVVFLAAAAMVFSLS